MTRALHRRAALAAAVLLVVLGTAALVPASAATLEVQNSRIVTNTAAACTTAVLPTTTPMAGAGQTTLRVGSVPTECVGRSMSVWLRNSSGAVISQGSLSPTAAGTNTVAVASYSTSAVASVVVTIDGWWIDTTWAVPVPPAPYSCISVNTSLQPTGAACTVNPVGPFNSWGSPGSRQGYANFTVTTTSANAIVSLNVNAAPFPTWTKGALGTNGDWIKVPGYSCSELPVLRLYANPAHGGKGTGVYVQFAESPSSSVGGRICPTP